MARGVAMVLAVGIVIAVAKVVVAVAVVVVVVQVGENERLLKMLNSSRNFNLRGRVHPPHLAFRL